MTRRSVALAVVGALVVMAAAVVGLAGRRSGHDVSAIESGPGDREGRATEVRAEDPIALAPRSPGWRDAGLTAASLEEAVSMTRLRRTAESDPARAIALAREGNQRFPDSADAPERTSILIHALAAEGLAMQARGEAEEMVNRYPDSQWVREIERFTGAHRHRNIRLNDAGVLVYY
jgi:hypothetical protein